MVAQYIGGNGSKNYIRDNGGKSEIITGGDRGCDIFYIHGSSENYSIENLGDGCFKVLNFVDGTYDILKKVDCVMFYDITVNLTPDYEGLNCDVAEPNTDPVAVDDYAEGAGCIILSPLANDYDPDGDYPLAITAVAGQEILAEETITIDGVGDVTLNFDGTLKFVPVDGLTEACFSYTLYDGYGGYDEAKISVAICDGSGKNAPVANDDAASGDEGQVIYVDALANDTDADGDALTIIGVSQPSNGSAFIGQHGQLVYVPAAGFTGSDSFTYTIQDVDGLTDTATVTVEVGTDHPGTNTDPVAVDDAASVEKDGSITIDVLGNDTDVDGDMLTVATYTSTEHGTLKLNADGTFTYTPLAGFTGNDFFVYAISDGKGGYDNAKVVIEVTDGQTGHVNKAPVAVDDNAAVENGQAVTIKVLDNDTDADGDMLTVATYTSAEHGTLKLNADGTFTYTPVAGFTGTDTFLYAITDDKGGYDTAKVTIEVTNGSTGGVNKAPVAVDDSGMTNKGEPVLIDVLANDTDPDGDAIHVSTVTQGSNGMVFIGANGQLIYIPKAGFTGTDTFTYTITDGDKESTASVTVVVDGGNGGGGNNAPDAMDDSGMTDAGVPVVVNLLANDTDKDGDSLTITDLGAPANGSVFLGQNGNVVYVPKAGFAGTDTFTYTISDGKGGTDTATVTVVVNGGNGGGNTAPVANDDSTSTMPGKAVLIDVVANDTDADGDTLIIGGVTAPANGSVYPGGDGKLVYLPNPGFTGTDTFTYEVSDGKGGSDIATVTVEVKSGNGGGTGSVDAVDDTAATSEETSVVIDVLANDSDPEGDAFAISTFTNGANGLVYKGTDGKLVYIPDAGFTGTDTFTYAIKDATGKTDTATVTVEVGSGNGGGNNAPVANDDSGSGLLNAAITIDVLANDTDQDGDTLSISGTTDGANGTVAVVDGKLVYTPAAGFEGADNFTYTISDGKGGTDTANVTVVVSGNNGGGNNAPDAVNDTAAGDFGLPVTIDVLSNDTDQDGDTLTITNATNGANGTVEIVGGKLVYTPNAGFSGTDIFEYTITDGNGGSDTASVAVCINPDVVVTPNSVDAVDDTAMTDQGMAVAIDVKGNDVDPEGDAFFITGFTNGANGTVAQNAAGQLVYTPEAGFFGTDAFEYTITDANGATDTATVTVEVKEEVVPNSVDAVDDAEMTDQGMAVAIDVTGNDADPEGDAFFISGFTNGANGSVSQNAAGQLVYTPEAGFFGTDTFEYTITDAKGATDTATVTVEVKEGQTSVIDALDDSSSTSMDHPVSIDVLVNDDVPAGSTVTAFTDGANGTVSEGADGKLVYTPNDGFVGNDSFTYTVTAPDGAMDTATVTVRVDPYHYQNTTDAVDDSAMTDQGMAVAIDVLGNDVDPQGDDFFISGFTDGANGSVSQNAAGQLVYTPEAGFFGTDTFEYTITDAKGATDTATVTVEVKEAPNEGPDAVDDENTTDYATAVSGNVLGNDTDPDGDDLMVIDHTQASNGSVVVNEDGTYTYTPEDGFSGEDSFTYTITDGVSGEDTATVTIQVGEKPNEGPDAVDDSGMVSCGQDGVTIDVLANDSDPDGDDIFVTGISDPANGYVFENADGTLTYVPNEGYSGSDTFTYTISDGEAESTATVSVDVEAAKQIHAEIVGDACIAEGEAGSYRIELDEAVSEDTWFTLKVINGTACRVDDDGWDVANQDFTWGGYYDTRSGVGGPLVDVYDDKVPNGTSVHDGNHDAIGPDGLPIWDYTVLQDGVVQVNGCVMVLVEAGQTASNSFDVQAWEEKMTIDQDSDFTRHNPDYVEGTETFSIQIDGVENGSCDVVTTGGPLCVEIKDTTHYAKVSPIALDLNGDGEIGVTGETTSWEKDPGAETGRTVHFDIDADGKLDTIEWFDGSGDGILVDMSKIGTGSAIDGSALFGDEGGLYANGYEKLATLDADGDGLLTGDELADMGLWIDDGDAKLEAGELVSAADAGIASISTSMEIVLDADGRELMQSSATTVDGQEVLSEDVWFDFGSDEADADVAVEPVHHADEYAGL